MFDRFASPDKRWTKIPILFENMIFEELGLKHWNTNNLQKSFVLAKIFSKRFSDLPKTEISLKMYTCRQNG